MATSWSTRSCATSCTASHTEPSAVSPSPRTDSRPRGIEQRGRVALAQPEPIAGHGARVLGITSFSAWTRASVAMVEAHEGGTRDASTRSDTLGRCAQAGETRLDLFGARTLGKLLQVSAISVGRGVLFTRLFLGARQVEQ